MKKIAIVGIVGVPANYGGFESLVENTLDLFDKQDHYTIYCSKKNYSVYNKNYKNAHLIYLPFSANGLQSIIYDICGIIHASIRKSDVILILGVSGCCFLPIYRIFSRRRLIINIDGLEHKRDKWNKWIKKFLSFSERMAVKYADHIITDNKAIQEYVEKKYNKTSSMIAYGGNHVLTQVSQEEEEAILNNYNLKERPFSFSVCRIEPENNVHLILEAFERAKKDLVFVGNWENNEYGKMLFGQYKHSQFVHLFKPIYDLSILFVLRSKCMFYVHGHSAGGTNPSLVEAMFFKKPIFAFDVVYNRETTENSANYFSSISELVELLNNSYDTFLLKGLKMYEIAEKRYRWEIISKQYENILLGEHDI